MRLFHISEESDIPLFRPRKPLRSTLQGAKPLGSIETPDPSDALVWAIDDKHLPNYLTPRNCPRVTYHKGPNTTPEDIERFFSSPAFPYVVAIEKGWFRMMLSTVLYCYQFNTADFTLQDEVAGYYVSRKTQVPIGKHRIDNLPEALFVRNVELRIVPTLWDLHDQVQASSLCYSMCRMKHAKRSIY